MANTFLKLQHGDVFVHIEGFATIDSAVQIHKLFTEVLEKKLPVNLDISKVTDCDGSFIQLITSLCYSLYLGEKSLIIDQNIIPQQFNECLKTLGYSSRCKCTRIDNLECPLSSLSKNSVQKLESSL